METFRIVTYSFWTFLFIIATYFGIKITNFFKIRGSKTLVREKLYLNRKKILRNLKILSFGSAFFLIGTVFYLFYEISQFSVFRTILITCFSTYTITLIYFICSFSIMLTRRKYRLK